NKLPADVRVGQAAGNHRQHLPLPIRQRGQPFPCHPLPVGPQIRREVADQLRPAVASGCPSAPRPAVPAMITVENLSKRYGSTTTVHDVSFTVEPDSIGFLGPNGAGKSTTRMLTGVTPPTSGRATSQAVRRAAEPGPGRRRDAGR